LLYRDRVGDIANKPCSGVSLASRATRVIAGEAQGDHQ
jgi:hypothetical protein